ncbi:hypothetical protein JCM10213_001113 [Rhodosporidiobolus nylandii]
MSTKPHKFWPSEGSKWQHWSDLVLATQLAAARAGFTSLGRTWEPLRPDLLQVRCLVDPTRSRSGTCRTSLVKAEPVDKAAPCGAWRVTDLHAAHLEAERHPAHQQGGIGISQWLKDRPVDPISLAPGDIVTGFRQMHTLEGSVRSLCRKTGHFVSAGVESGRMRTTTYSISCVLNPQRCGFLVRLEEFTAAADGEPRWRCIEIRKAHTCLSDAKEPQERLDWRMDFFPELSLQEGCVGSPLRVRRSLSNLEHMTQVDQRIGFFPVRPASYKPPSPPAIASSSATVTSSQKKEARTAEKDLESKKALLEKRRKKLEKARRKEKKRKETPAGSGEKSEKRRKKEKKREGAKETKAKL